MDVNGIQTRGAYASIAGPAVPTPAPSPRVQAAQNAGAQAAREVEIPRPEERAPDAPDVLAARSAAIARGGTRLRFDEATERIVAQIVNKNNEVIRQIPPEAFLRFAARFRNLIGVLFDQSV